MSDSFQSEIPKGRVNLKVEIQTNGAAKSIELPHKTLVMADFSHGKGRGPVLDRRRIPITRITRDQVMAEISPELSMLVENKLGPAGEEVQINLRFKKLDDFHPESLVEQVPSLKRLLAMRNLLKELRSNIMDNNDLKHALGEMISDESSREALKLALQTALPRKS